MRLAIVMIFVCSFEAGANSLRTGKLINNFLQHRVKAVAEAIRLDFLHEIEFKHLNASDVITPDMQVRIDRIVNDPSYIPNAAHELNTYVQSLPITKGTFYRLHDRKGGVHHLLGTVHKFSINNLEETVFDELEQIIDGSKLLLGERTGNPFIREAKLLDKLEISEDLPSLHELDSLDDQISLLAMLKGKRVNELETYADIRAGIEASGLRADDLTDNTDEINRLISRQLGDKQQSMEDAIIKAIVDEQIKGSYLKLLYSKADTRALTNILLTSLDKTDEILLGYRNKLWAERITDACSKEKSCFIYTGVSHLLIDSGNIRSLVSLLQERGYEIEALF